MIIHRNSDGSVMAILTANLTYWLF